MVFDRTEEEHKKESLKGEGGGGEADRQRQRGEEGEALVTGPTEEEHKKETLRGMGAGRQTDRDRESKKGKNWYLVLRKKKRKKP